MELGRVFLRWVALLASFFFKVVHATQTQPVVLVSIASYQEIVQEMAGSDICVVSIVPHGTSCHSFEPTPYLVRTLSGATLWFTIGESFENRILQALQGTPSSPTIVDLRQGVPLLHIDEQQSAQTDIDSHLWTSPRIMKLQLRTIRAGLLSSYPEMKEKIEERFQSMNRRIDILISDVDKHLSGFQGRLFLVAHAAYGYLCHDYGIEQRAIEIGGKEATSQKLGALLQEAIRKGVKTVFALKQYPKNGIERVADVLGAKVIELDAYQPHYWESMRITAQGIGLALGEEKE